MKRFFLFATLGLSAATLFSSCEKKVEEPGPVVCFFDTWIPIRVINTKNEDLLNPAKLPNGTVEIRWLIPGSNMNPVRLAPSVYSIDVNKGDQYYISAPLNNADKGLTVYFSVKQGDTDTLFMRTAANSSKPYGLAELSINGVRTEPKILFHNNLANSTLGVEVVKDGNRN
ncbi:hypothetical protein GWC95_03435 [Sediminibacterium roseum]|uniref:Uncharacterized protein n=1 Tax=Sediminibacterium roseum TaxID=1978412 RepID=A0ABW9ZPE2_9BACT|nr:hypothetical protein [Sediminibacterium roseum]NCI48959.1 hypothetical protein [Sediminibacterium roseum]